jgi:hypothetical protein
MKLQTDQIVGKISDWCFIQEPKSYHHHFLFQDLLVSFLKENGWMTYKEYEIENYPRLNPINEKIRDRQGFFDLVAFAHNKKIAIEYDNVTQLKSRSISKLFNSNADYPIGIVRGKHGKPFLRFENSAKIKRIARESKIMNKKIYLIIIENQISELIEV